MNLANPYSSTIAAIIAIITAVLAPVLTTLLNNRHQYKMKAVDLLFNAKLEAYKNYIKVTSNALANSSTESQKALDNAMSYALLLSSGHTQVLLLQYSHALVNNSNADYLGKLQAEVILSMQKDLYEFKKYHKQYTANNV